MSVVSLLNNPFEQGKLVQDILPVSHDLSGCATFHMSRIRNCLYLKNQTCAEMAYTHDPRVSIQ